MTAESGVRRRWILGTGAGVALLAVAATVLAEPALTGALRAAGFPDAVVTVAGLAPGEVRLAVSLDKDGRDRIDSLALGFSAGGLLAGRLDGVTARGLRLRAALRADGTITIAGRTLGGGEGGGSGPPALPADVVTVEDGALTLDTGTAAGTVAVPFGLTLTRTPQGASGRLDVPKGPLAERMPALAKPNALGGAVAATSRFAWDGAALTASGEVLLSGVAATLGPVTAAGVNGVVRLSSLAPPVIPDGQTLAITMLDVGLPLTDGVVSFGLGRDGRLHVGRAEWRWGGGVLRARPFKLSPTNPKGTVELEAEGVEFGRLLALAAVDGLAASGTLRGRLPVILDGGTVRIVGGVLESAAPGTLAYDPATPPAFLAGDPGSPTELLRAALTDFRYQSLRLTVDGTAGGELAVKLALEGANPAFHDGYPVRLHLNLSGALDRILRQSLDAHRIPDAVRDRMMEFGRKTP